MAFTLRYERQHEGPNEAKRKVKEPSQLTRSQTSPYDKAACFFCEEKGNAKQPLHNVSTFSAGESLNEAINLSENDVFRVKLSTAVDATDAHAIDIKYHKNCWLRNVTNVIKKAPFSENSSSDLVSEAAARIEFLAMTQTALREGEILTMCELQNIFEELLRANDVQKATCSRKALKLLLLSEIPDIEFHKSKRMNEAERVIIKETRDEAIQLSEDVKAKSNEEMKVLFDAAATLRKAIHKSKRWEFTGTLEDVSESVVPEELYRFSMWLIQGPKTDKKLRKQLTEDVKRRALSLCQTAVSMCLTEKQSNNKKSETLRLSREMPQQLAVGLAVHQLTRSKELVNMLHGFGMSVEYNRVMRVEAQIEATVLERMEQNGGVYLPPDIVKGRHVFFAIDNVDFAEDTYDGKRTLHGAAMAIYQKKDSRDDKQELR